MLAAALGMEHRCYAANLNHPADDHADRPHPYGTLILSRFPIRSCNTTPLPRTGENEQRGFTLAVIDVRGVSRCSSTTRTCTRPRPTGCSRRPSSRRRSTRRSRARNRGRRLQRAAHGDGAGAALRPARRRMDEGWRWRHRQPGRPHLAGHARRRSPGTASTTSSSPRPTEVRAAASRSTQDPSGGRPLPRRRRSYDCRSHSLACTVTRRVAGDGPLQPRSAEQGVDDDLSHGDERAQNFTLLPRHGHAGRRLRRGDTTRTT